MLRSVFSSHVLCVGCLLGVSGVSQLAHAQAAKSDCYFDKMRMVDALPLAGQKRETDETTGNLHYLLSLPQGHDKTKKWPVVVFMHGIGEVNAQGNMLNGLTKHSLPRMVEDPMFNYPFIVISPQIASDGWVKHAVEIGAALDRVETEFGGDKNREYLTGLSYGGVGTFAVGIELAARIAALMPVTPGGSVENWAQRDKLKDKPIWLFNGLLDKEYEANSTRVKELEASGGAAFFKYTYAFADEYKDAVPQAALLQKHVFGSYENIGHDVWHAAYGVYCPTLDAQKTVQYDWLLAQSLDGSPFVDPRNPNAGVGGAGGSAAGGAAGTSGAAGQAGAAVSGGGSGGAGGGGQASVDNFAGSPTAGALATAGSAGAATAGSGAATPSNAGQENDDSAGCNTTPASPKRAGVVSLSLLAALFELTRRRRAPVRARARGGALPQAR